MRYFCSVCGRYCSDGVCLDCRKEYADMDFEENRELCKADQQMDREQDR